MTADSRCTDCGVDAAEVHVGTLFDEWSDIFLTDLVNRTLTSVDLSGNNFRAEGAKVVADVLPQCKYVA